MSLEEEEGVHTSTPPRGKYTRLHPNSHFYAYKAKGVAVVRPFVHKALWLSPADNELKAWE